MSQSGGGKLPAAIVALAVLAALAGLFAGRWWFADRADDAASGALAIGERRPDLVLSALDGRPQSLDQFDGQPLLINYWATWCPPCIEELPRLQALHARRADDGIAVLAIALEHDAEAVRQFIARHGLALPVWLEAPGAGDSSVGFGNLRGVLPYSVLLDARGRLLQRRAGVLSEADLSDWARRARAD